MLVLSVDTEQTRTSDVITQLSNQVDLLDVTIESQPIEDIIVQLYKEYPNMRVYASVLKLRLLIGMQYRAAALAGVATQFFWGFISIMVFEAFYSHAVDYTTHFVKRTNYLHMAATGIPGFYYALVSGQ